MLMCDPQAVAALAGLEKLLVGGETLPPVLARQLGAAVGGEVHNIAWSGPTGPAHPTFPIAAGLTGIAVQSRSTVIANDVARDPRYLTNQASTGSELIVPILIGEQVVGTLDVEAAERGAFDERDRVLFETLAAALAELYA